ncbi:MAG: 6-phosphogluconolactonase [Methylocystaceae bacterium]|nr:6-phosphogluconolactonase [Methylocystaceae bacterium]
MPNVQINRFDNRQQWANALADKMADQLAKSIDQNDLASMALSGGRSPAPLLEALSGKDLDWSKVTITLVDDRWVPLGSERSNEALVRTHLLKNKAKAATFFGLTTNHSTPKAGLSEVESRLKDLPLPFSTLFLGLGEDGHTASLFPCAPADELAYSFAPDHGEKVCAIHPKSQPEARITLTLPTILNSDHIALFIYGEDKWKVLEQAMKEGEETALPIRAVLRRSLRPVNIYWAA